MAFVKAVKQESKLRLAIAGPSGSGKTYTSLAIATALGGPVAFVDTEHGSASKYADLFEFDVMEMEPPYHPDRYVAAIREAANAGYKVIVLDSLTHAWNGTGGLLDVVEEAAKRMKTTNTFAAWKDATPVQNRLTDGIVSAPIHVIATMRSKQEYVLEKDDRGYNQVAKKGMAPIQRDGFEYEFDVFLDMDVRNNAIVTKTRCPALTGGFFSKPGADIAGILAEWLHGELATAQPKPAPADDTKALESARKAFHAAITGAFNGDADDARHWLIQRYTTKQTPDNVRNSTNALTVAELDDLRQSFNKYKDTVVTDWKAAVMDKLGVEVYGNEWKTVRAHNVERITKGEGNLTIDDYNNLIAGLHKLKAQRAEVA